MIQTKVTDENRLMFYKTVYFHQNQDKNQLIQLDHSNIKNYLVVDCCGWYYKKHWPETNIIAVETIKSAAEFKFDRIKVDKLIDNNRDDHIVWPTIDVQDCALVFDQSPLLKYRSIEEISQLFAESGNKYKAKVIKANLNLTFIDGPRLLDRFYNISKIFVSGYIITCFEYNINQGLLKLDLQKN